MSDARKQAQQERAETLRDWHDERAGEHTGDPREGGYWRGRAARAERERELPDTAPAGWGRA